MTSIQEPVSGPRARTWTREGRARLVGALVLLVSQALCVSPDWGVDISRVCAATLLGAWCLLAWPKPELSGLIGWPGVVAAGGFAIVCTTQSDLSRTLGACAWVAALATAWRSGGYVARSISLAAGLVGVAWTGRLATPWLFEVVRQPTLAWSRALGNSLGRSIEIGPTMQGWSLLGLGAALLLARFAILEWRPKQLACGLSILVLSSGALALVVDVAALSAPSEFVALLPWLAVIPLGTVAAVCVFVAEHASRPASMFGFRGWAAVVGGSIALLMALHARVVVPSAAPRVLFYSANEGRILDWRKPAYGHYGAYSLGFFGLLPEHLAADGFSVSFLRDAITSERLAETDLLVTLNVNTQWTEDELLAVWEFVHAGGSLLVLGDHTDVDGSMRSQNDLLAPVGIEFQFDSAVPTHVDGWERSDLYLHPIHARVESAGALATAVGGSLKIQSFGALPLVVGRYGLADRGDADAADRAFLGDYRYQPGEQLGDVVLAAWSRLGAGAVVVFGDTSGLQNAALELSYTRWAHGLFTWLAGDTLFDLGSNAAFLAGMLFIACGCAVVAMLRQRPVQIGVVLLGLWATLEGSALLERRWCFRESNAAASVLIDTSHLPRIQRGANSDLSLDGFKNCAMRSGYRVGTMHEFSSERLARASVLLTVAPAEPYTAPETQELTRFMENGGFVLACSSYPHREGLESLLGAVGLTVLPTPIGPIPLQRDPERARIQVEYVDAWEVGVRADYAGEAPWVYGEFQGRPLAILARRGHGGLFLVGDSAFFGAANLETLNSFSEPNILFLRALLADLEDLRKERTR